MNIGKILTALMLVLSSNAVFAMITMKTGVDAEHGEYVLYKQELSNGYSIKCIMFEQLGKCIGCTEQCNQNNPGVCIRKPLEQGVSEWNEFWRLAREYKIQNQKNEDRKSAKNDRLVASKGKNYTIEWYRDGKGSCQAREFYQMLTPAQQSKFENLFARVVEGSMPGETRFRNEGDSIYAFKAIPDRLLCFFTDNAKIIITNAFEKRTDKLSSTEKDLALKARFDYYNRCKTGTYYKE